MATERIKPESRKSFLEGFTSQHRGWLVTVDRIGSDGEAEVVIDGLPLQGVSDDGGAITITAGAEGDDEQRSHRVDGAGDLLIDRVEGDAILAVRIVGASEETVLRFRTVISPMLVDGIV